MPQMTDPERQTLLDWFIVAHLADDIGAAAHRGQILSFVADPGDSEHADAYRFFPLLSGFIDTHIHYAQTNVIASGGRRLLTVACALAELLRADATGSADAASAASR